MFSFKKSFTHLYLNLYQEVEDQRKSPDLESKSDGEKSIGIVKIPHYIEGVNPKV